LSQCLLAINGAMLQQLNTIDISKKLPDISPQHEKVRHREAFHEFPHAKGCRAGQPWFTSQNWAWLFLFELSDSGDYGMWNLIMTDEYEKLKITINQVIYIIIS